MTSTLEEVRSVIASGKRGSWRAVNVYVTGYVAENEFPQKFLYRGCTEEKGNGFRCSKSLERGPCRDHGPGGTWRYMFRFDVYAVDPSISYTAGPLRLTIFDAAMDVIGMSPDLFQKRNEIAQMELVHAATQKLETVCLDLSFNPGKDSFPIVECVTKDGPRIPIRTLPSISRSAPRPSRRTVDDVPSTADKNLQSSKKQAARKLLDELVEVLGNTHLPSI